MGNLPRIHPVLAEVLTEIEDDAWRGGFSYALGVSAAQRFDKDKHLDILVRGDSRALAAIQGHGGTVTLQVRDLVAARVPHQAVISIGQAAGVQSVKPSLRARRRLDHSLADLCGLSVPGPRPPAVERYRGKGVLIGIVDTGIDWKHPDFLTVDSGGTSRTRLRAYWDQRTDVRWDRNELDAALLGRSSSTPSVDDDGHGTHVASIAAGNGSASSGRYVGVAPEADLAIVKTTFRVNAVGEAIEWIQKQAGGQPCVINLSLGSHYGPHDGTGDFDTIVDGLSGPGRVIVVAAGNEGNDPIHTHRLVKAGERWVSDIVIRPIKNPAGAFLGVLHVEEYHDTGIDLGVRLRTPTGDLLAPRPLGAFEQFSGPARVRFTRDQTIAGTVNHSVFVTFPQGFDPRTDARGWSLIFQTGTEDSLVHAWIPEGENAHFVNFTPEYTVGEPATASEAIAVSAHCTRRDWDALDGSHPIADAIQLGQIAYFSSIGPTRDGRERPDLAAPGFYVMAASSQSVAPTITQRVQDRTGRYVVNAGTSMACPHVAGAIALLMEKEGALSPADIRNRLRSATRGVGGTWSSRWGMGRLDLTELLR